jgi:predicted  nucleic acid-binding Zn-ribbon protein
VGAFPHPRLSVLEGLQGLVDLSKVDTDLTSREQALVEIPNKRADCEEKRGAGQTRIEAAREALKEVELSQRRSETEAQEKQALLEKLEGQQHQVKTNEAYSALLSEMEQARSAISDAETNILEAMEAIENAKAAFAASERDVASALSKIEGEERLIDEQSQSLDGEIERLRALRDEIAGKIEAKLLDRYTRIAKRRSPPVVTVNNELCRGCRVDIPPQSYIEILKGEELITCERCHRILIHEDQLLQAAV